MQRMAARGNLRFQIANPNEEQREEANRNSKIPGQEGRGYQYSPELVKRPPALFATKSGQSRLTARCNKLWWPNVQPGRARFLEVN